MWSSSRAMLVAVHIIRGMESCIAVLSSNWYRECCRISPWLPEIRSWIRTRRASQQPISPRTSSTGTRIKLIKSLRVRDWSKVPFSWSVCRLALQERDSHSRVSPKKSSISWDCQRLATWTCQSSSSHLPARRTIRPSSLPRIAKYSPRTFSQTRSVQTPRDSWSPCWERTRVVREMQDSKKPPYRHLKETTWFFKTSNRPSMRIWRKRLLRLLSLNSG